MRKTILLFSVLAFGCGKSADKAMEEMKAIADHACACKKDKACGEKALDEMIAAIKENKNVSGGDEKEGRKIGERFGRCVVESGVSAQDMVAKLRAATN